MESGVRENPTKHRVAHSCGLYRDSVV
ncbi:uncharacterized protein G2W53_020087 [Senna tora]|uniref:Uncharacterized protein n=1 Tax=Senna tora TaxID=362788 RepID=A0A834TVC8_9FABA|nr:uncharacterized protein G2W53_020087 [Senna tora]